MSEAERHWQDRAERAEAALALRDLNVTAAIQLLRKEIPCCTCCDGVGAYLQLVHDVLAQLDPTIVTCSYCLKDLHTECPSCGRRLCTEHAARSTYRCSCPVEKEKTIGVVP